MGFYLLHAGTSLQKSTIAGTISNITLPTGVTMLDTRPLRAALLESTVVVVNAPSRNIAVNPSTLTTRLLCIDGPTTSLTAVTNGPGELVGEYRYCYTFAIIAGSIILTESPRSPLSDPVGFNGHAAALSSIDVSGTAGVTHRIIYRTTSNGAEFFEVTRIADNSSTTTTENVSDYDLKLLPIAEARGNPPGTDGTDRFRLIVSWKDRLFASPANDPDYVYVSGNRDISSWSTLRRFTVQSKGEDSIGVTGFMPRRDELVMGKRRKLWKLIGTSPDDYEQVLIVEGIGVMSQEAAIVVRDQCYFLAEDGFYVYGNEGLVSLTRDKVHPWFTTNDYFNREMFDNAFAYHNQKYDTIHLHLAAAGSTNLDRWVRYDMKQQEWFGPDKTAAFTPTCGGAMDDSIGFNSPVMGSSAGFLYRLNSSTASDDGTAIEFDVEAKFHNANTPDIEKYWGQPAIITKIEAAGTLSVVPKVGALNASAQSTISVDLTLGRARPRRLGTGRMCQLRFYNNENNQNVTIYGYDIPFHELGRR